MFPPIKKETPSGLGTRFFAHPFLTTNTSLHRSPFDARWEANTRALSKLKVRLPPVVVF